MFGSQKTHSKLMCVWPFTEKVCPPPPQTQSFTIGLRYVQVDVLRDGDSARLVAPGNISRRLTCTTIWYNSYSYKQPITIIRSVHRLKFQAEYFTHKCTLNVTMLLLPGCVRRSNFLCRSSEQLHVNFNRFRLQIKMVSVGHRPTLLRYFYCMHNTVSVYCNVAP